MKKLLGTTIVLALALSGCSAWQTGYYQKINITTEPDNAVCRVFNSKGVTISTIVSEGTARVRRDREDLTVTCSKKGWADTQVSVATGTGEETAKIFLGLLSDVLTQTTTTYPVSIHVKLVR